VEDSRKYPGKLVFGLDIGTRSIVGTVGYKNADRFYVVAQRSKEHETRAMLDGQIHDIPRVGATIATVKNELEAVIGDKLHDVCIAAAGRVLKTVTVHAEMNYETEKEITVEDIYELESKGIETAYAEHNKEYSGNLKFYCVGYSVVRYYMGGYIIGNLESHTAKEIGVDLIATFLPEDVVDGLNKAVGQAGLEVANMTLEPIAAISVAIPQNFRMLNIALVDVGAGTSDISITSGGSIIAYGMIPIAGDALTEVIANHCLVDFAAAEEIKRQMLTEDIIKYNDIIGLPQTISREELLNVVAPVLDNMTTQVADKIKELNGEKTVSAVFVVGGGGKIPTYTDYLAEKLGIQKERCVLRGEEVMGNIHFMEKDTKKDSLLVTPIGICLSFYEQNNGFVFVNFNGERVKLYDNGKMAVVDAAMQADYSNEDLFPKRGTPLVYTFEGKQRMHRGEPGEGAVIFVNDKPADLYTPVHANDYIQVNPSTAGAPAKMEIQQIPEYGSVLRVIVNDKKIDLPKYAMVNGQLQSGYYEIQQNDEISLCAFYTVKQITEFMDVVLKPEMNIYVNNKLADMDTPVYENFAVIWTLEELDLSDLTKYGMGGDTFENLPEAEEEDIEKMKENQKARADQAKEELQDLQQAFKELRTGEFNPDDEANAVTEDGAKSKDSVESNEPKLPVDITVMVNNLPVHLSGKAEYVFVDVFDKIDFDLSKPQGSSVAAILNGRDAQYMEKITAGDSIQIFWRK